jgi:murein hydrolase activator
VPRPACLLLLCLALACSFAAQAQDARQLQGVESALRASRQKAAELGAAAAALAREMAGLQVQLVQAGADTQAAEAELSDLEASLGRLEPRRAAKAQDLAQGRRALGASLAALERLAATPPGAVLAGGSPLDLARGSLLLAVAVPELRRRAAGLEADLAALAALQRDIAARQARAQIVLASLRADRGRIADLLRRRAALQRRTAAEAAAANARSAKLAVDAKDLQQLIERLAEQRRKEEEERQQALAEQRRQELERQQKLAEAQRQAQFQAPAQPPAQPQQQAALTPGNVRPFPSAPGSLAAPVSGRIVLSFGTPNEAGSTSKGILLETRPEAAVLAPFDGQVVFYGPFRSYGEILIIQHSGGYHSLLAGLAHSNAAVGQWVVAGEPVGAMAPSKDGNPKLYMELRRDGHPIDPAPWLGKTDSKVE